MVPEGWVKAKLGKLVSISSGIAPSALSLSENGKYPYVKVEDMNNCSKYQESSRTYSDDEVKYIPKGSVIFPKRGAAIMNNKVRISAVDLYLDSNMMSLYPGDEIDTEFLYYSLIREELHRIADTSTIPQINNKHITPYTVMLPSLAEQKKIAQILSTWDQAITTTEQLLANSRQQKKALMQQLLTGKQRLLDKDGERFSGEWKKVKLGSVANMNSGGTPKSTIGEYYGGDIPWVSISDMTKQGKWIASTEKYLTTHGLENSTARIYPKNSVLYAMYASIGECSIAQVPLSSSQAILGIRPKAELDFEFLYFFLTSLKERIKLQGQQGTQSNLNARMVKDFLLYLPCIEEQQKIAAVLSTADREIDILQQKLDALRQEKKALMQQLLTGKRRVITEQPEA
ncbi:restriction endonuclease subunit S [Oceanimonas pelagia]|uniref:Restriction endonuclease subunit S n=1 Tax=Oceanimonas pelagia TaxID=3028314 RepID=A0AA50KN85_9GAMM|nr:restriction endonuclease subunit S [Oceanimonas pelagia]WMC10664.1 restriction endonuclease subunit S [Oceanimonas pelagia]